MGKEWDEEVRATLRACEKEQTEKQWAEDELGGRAKVLMRTSANAFSCE